MFCEVIYVKNYRLNRRQVLNGYHLYGEMHRFLPAFAAQVGAKIVEVPVKLFMFDNTQKIYRLG